MYIVLSEVLLITILCPDIATVKHYQFVIVSLISSRSLCRWLTFRLSLNSAPENSSVAQSMDVVAVEVGLVGQVEQTVNKQTLQLVMMWCS